MSIDFQGLSLNLASRFAGSEFAEKYGLRKPAEKMAYTSTKTGFKMATKAIALFKKQSKSKGAGERAEQKKTDGLFDLTLSEEQQMIRDSMQGYATEVIRQQAIEADENSKLPEGFMDEAQALGINFFSVPESLGGAGEYSPLTSALVAEDLALGDMGLALATLAPASVVNAISRWGSKAQQETYLPDFCGEQGVKATIAVQEPHALFSPEKLKTTAKKSGNGYVISGVKTMVPFGGDASLYLIAAEYKGEPRIFIVPADKQGLSWKDGPAMGLRAAELGTLKLDKVKVGNLALLGDHSDDENDFDYQEFINLGQLSWCAMAIGCCQAATDYCIQYANEREAFGEPISHRQAVAFMIATMATETEGMRLLTWRAASLAEQGKKFHKETFLAHHLCVEKAMQIGTDAVQILGGHGFTKEHPCERYYRDLRALSAITSGLHL